MAEKPDEIKQHIEAQRERLGENLQYLEHRVRSAADWRTWVERRPLAMLGLAFGAGVYMAFKLGR